MITPRTRGERLLDITTKRVEALTDDPEVAAEAVRLATTFPQIQSFEHAVEVAQEIMDIASGRSRPLERQLFPGAKIAGE